MDPQLDPEIAAAIRQLRLGNAHERLAAARSLNRTATAAEVEALQAVRRREMDHYVASAIDEAIELARKRPPRAVETTPTDGDEVDEPSWDDKTYAQALRAATTSLVHELRRPLGLARLAIERGELDATSSYLARIDRLLEAMERLGVVAAGGTRSEFDLRDVVREVSAEQSERLGVPVEVLEVDSALVTGDRGAVELVVRNAIANACESTALRPADERRAVAVGYGVTDRDAWVAVLDHGVGLPDGFDPFAFAASRKDEHDGVGLTLARQAARSMQGELSLAQRIDGGVTLRFSWSQGGT